MVGETQEKAVLIKKELKELDLSAFQHKFELGLDEAGSLRITVMVDDKYTIHLEMGSYPEDPPRVILKGRY